MFHFHVDYRNIIVLQEQSTGSVLQEFPRGRIRVLFVPEYIAGHSVF